MYLEKLELIRPKYNPVPEYGDDGSDFTADVDEIEATEEAAPAPSASEEKEELEEEEEDVEIVSDGFENGIETEASSPLVEINGIEETQNGSEGEDGYDAVFYRTHPLLYNKFGNMALFWPGNLYSLYSPGNQDYQKIIYFLKFFIKTGRNRRLSLFYEKNE